MSDLEQLAKQVGRVADSIQWLTSVVFLGLLWGGFHGRKDK